PVPSHHPSHPFWSEVERPQDVPAPLLQSRRRLRHQCHVSEFPPLAWRLPVQVQVSALYSHYAFHLRKVSENVEHHRPAARRRDTKGQRQHRAKMILELARLGALDRPVPG